MIKKMHPVLMFFLAGAFGVCAIVLGKYAADFLWLGIEYLKQENGINLKGLIYWLLVLFLGGSVKCIPYTGLL